jgi:hypothetical protein
MFTFQVRDASRKTRLIEENQNLMEFGDVIDMPKDKETLTR